MENESQQNKIISLLTKKDLIDIIIIDKFIPISIQTESFNKILIQSGMIDNKNISNYIYFYKHNIKISQTISFSKNDLVWLKIENYQIYFGIFGFDSCQLKVKDLKKISSMIFKTHKLMIPYINLSLKKNNNLNLKKPKRRVQSDILNFNNNSLIKNELSINPNLIQSTSIEFVDVTDIYDKNHKILKEHLDYAIEKIKNENIDINNIIINFFDFPENKIFPIKKKWLINDFQELTPRNKNYYLISIAKIKIKNNMKE
jgi:hypothetical protein